MKINVPFEADVKEGVADLLFQAIQNERRLFETSNSPTNPFPPPLDLRKQNVMCPPYKQVLCNERVFLVSQHHFIRGMSHIENLRVDHRSAE
jgi:hypothetical protein